MFKLIYLISIFTNNITQLANKVQINYIFYTVFELKEVLELISNLNYSLL